MSDKKRRKHLRTTGSRLQRQRLWFSGKPSAYKSQKVLLQCGDMQYHQKLINRIQFDYRNLTGSLQLSDFLGQRNEQSQHSILEFIVDCWRAGMLFAPTAAKLHDTVRTLNNDNSAINAVHDALRQKGLDNIIDADRVIELILNIGEVRANAGQGKINQFMQCFHEAYRVNHATEAVRTTQYWYDSCKGKGQEGYQEFFHQELGIMFPDVSIEKRTCTFYPKAPFMPNAPADQVLASLFTLSEGKKDTLEQYCGVANTHSAFSIFFNQTFPILHERCMDVLYDMFSKDFDFWRTTDGAGDLRRRIIWLSERASKLPLNPRVAKNWASYRTIIGGKIQSWVSNSISRPSNWQQRLDENKTLLEAFVEEPIFKSLISAQVDKNSSLIHYALKLKRTINEIDKISSAQLAMTDVLHPLYNSLVKRYNSEFNDFIQELDPPKKLEKTLSKYRAINSLDKKWGFLGSSKKERYQSFITLIPRLKTNMTGAARLILECNTKKKDIVSLHLGEEETKRILQQYLRKRHTVFSNRYRSKLKDMFLTWNIDIDKISDNEVIYAQPRAQKNMRILPVDVSKINVLSFIEHFGLWTHPPIAFSHLQELFDWTELCKTAIASYEKIMPDTETHLLDWFVAQSDKPNVAIQDYEQSLQGERITLQKAHSIIQQEVLAQIRGDLSTMSTKQYIERHVISYTGIDRDFQFVLQLKNLDGPVVRENRKTWGIWEKMQEGTAGMYVFDSSDDLSDEVIRPKRKENISEDRVLNFTTSKYQIGHLDRLLPSSQGKKPFIYKAGEFSLISETTYSIRWDNPTNTPSIHPAGDPRLFVSMPIETTPIQTHDTKWLPQRYVGIDVGEYGVAHAVIQLKEDRVNIINTGFIIEPELRKIREYIKTTKERQRKGTFSMRATLLQAYREQAVKAIRNRIHDLIMRYRAPVIYEGSISNFETGSNRLTNVYNTLKIADTPDYQNDIDKKSADEAWGKNAKVRGHQVPSYNTSRTCLACKRCYSTEIEKRFSIEKMEVVDQTTIKLGDLTFKVYSYEMSSNPDLGKLVQSAYKYSRPPIDAPHIAATNLGPQHMNMRGNSAIFICPICGAQADADIQAAVCVGLKQAFRAKYEKVDWDRLDRNLRFGLWLDWIHTLEFVGIQHLRLR